MASTRTLLGGAGAAALAARIVRSLRTRRREAPAPKPEPEPEPMPLPDADREDVDALRADLRRELDRLAGAHIKPSGSSGEQGTPAG